ncbi:MAG: hypothetical protein FJ279_29030, partial [Planctomycetes bacterium]|nr:hypothetical protein [Planctomycetota bacterium]
MHELKHPGIMDGFYFDNAGMRIDWGPLAMERWKKVSQERFGKVVDPKTSDDLAVRMAWLDMQYRAYFEFHGAFWKHGWTYNPPRLTLLGAHGAYGYYESETDFPDIEFYENTYRVQPESDNIWELKCGLARTHGKAQACLNHERWRPEKLSPDGSFAVLNWFLTREFGRLSMAECMAMNGNHMLQIGPLTYAHMRYGADYRLYNEFNRQLEPEIYRNALPAARLAVLWSPASEGRGSTDNELLGRRLWMMGVPYEVVVEHDLKTEIWPAMGMDALILSDVRCLNEPRVALALDWVRKGGRCLVAQSLAERDEFGMRQNSASARALLGDVGGRIRYDADPDFQLEMFEPERGGGRIWIPQILKDPPAKPREGNAAVVFTGPTAAYDLRLECLDEDDGRSPITLYRNQDVVAKFVLDQQNNKRLIKLFPNVKLSTGDRLRIHAVQDADEFCRIFSLEAVPAGADVETVTYRDVGQGRVAFAPKALMDYPPAELEAVLQKLTDGKLERCTYPRKDGEQGAVFCNLMRDSQQRGLQVHLVNASYATPERYAPLCSTAAVCRAEVSLAKVPKAPVVRVLCWGRGKGWQLAASVNGTDLEPVDAGKVQDTIWVDIPAKPELLKEGANRVTLRLTGKPNTWGDHAAIYIDAEKSAPQSAFSADGGKSFSADDLSTLTDAQRGAYMLEITSARPAPPRPPEMRVRLVPHENVEVRVKESSVPPNASALVISPDLPPARIPVQREKGLAVLRVAKLQVYSVAVLSADAAYLSAIELKARGIQYD